MTLVRDARPEDAEALARFNEAMALETEGVHLDPSAVRAGVRAVLEDPSKGRYIVAERGGRPAGALLLTYEWSDWRNGMFLWIQSVYVEPAERKKGIFTSLFRQVEEIAARPGHCGVRLYMEADNATARKTYERLGLDLSRYRVFESRDPLRERGGRSRGHDA
ncbi:MAG TPA: GNAT family N-acetyltransferase [Planctomycetota bacterium]|nr:GNAT family N-acetyltransferase [Planctomycetota bacterium]